MMATAANAARAAGSTFSGGGLAPAGERGERGLTLGHPEIAEIARAICADERAVAASAFSRFYHPHARLLNPICR